MLKIVRQATAEPGHEKGVQGSRDGRVGHRGYGGFQRESAVRAFIRFGRTGRPYRGRGTRWSPRRCSEVPYDTELQSSKRTRIVPQDTPASRTHRTLATSRRRSDPEKAVAAEDDGPALRIDANANQNRNAAAAGQDFIAYAGFVPCAIRDADPVADDDFASNADARFVAVADADAGFVADADADAGFVADADARFFAVSDARFFANADAGFVAVADAVGLRARRHRPRPTHDRARTAADPVAEDDLAP